MLNNILFQRFTLFSILAFSGVSLIISKETQAGTVYSYSEQQVKQINIFIQDVNTPNFTTETSTFAAISGIKNGVFGFKFTGDFDSTNALESHVVPFAVLSPPGPSPCGEDRFSPCGDKYTTPPAKGLTDNPDGGPLIGPSFARADVFLSAPGLDRIEGANNAEVYLKTGAGEILSAFSESKWKVITDVFADGVPFSVSFTSVWDTDLFASIWGYDPPFEIKLAWSDVRLDIQLVPVRGGSAINIFDFFESVHLLNVNGDDKAGGEFGRPGNRGVPATPGGYRLIVEAVERALAVSLNHNGVDPYISLSLTHFDVDTGELVLGGMDAMFISGVPTKLPIIDAVLDSNGNVVDDPLLGSLLDYSGIFLEEENSDGTFSFSDGLLQALDPSDPKNILFSADVVDIIANPTVSLFSARLENIVPGSLSLSSSSLLKELVSAGSAATWLDSTIIELTESFTQTATTVAPFASDTFPTPTPESSSTLSLLAIGIGGTALTLKRKLKPFKSTEKETEKLSSTTPPYFVEGGD